MEGATFRKPLSLFGKSGCNIPLRMALYPSSSFRISWRATFSRSARSFSASSSANHSNNPLQHWPPCILVGVLIVCTCAMLIAPNFSSVRLNSTIDCVLWYVPTVCASLLGANIILILIAGLERHTNSSGASHTLWWFLCVKMLRWVPGGILGVLRRGTLFVAYGFISYFSIPSFHIDFFTLFHFNHICIAGHQWVNGPHGRLMGWSWLCDAHPVVCCLLWLQASQLEQLIWRGAKMIACRATTGYVSMAQLRANREQTCWHLSLCWQM